MWQFLKLTPIRRLTLSMLSSLGLTVGVLTASALAQASDADLTASYYPTERVPRTGGTMSPYLPEGITAVEVAEATIASDDH